MTRSRPARRARPGRPPAGPPRPPLGRPAADRRPSTGSRTRFPPPAGPRDGSPGSRRSRPLPPHRVKNPLTNPLDIPSPIVSTPFFPFPSPAGISPVDCSIHARPHLHTTPKNTQNPRQNPLAQYTHTPAYFFHEPSSDRVDPCIPHIRHFLDPEGHLFIC